MLLRYANYFQVMVQQHAACNAVHKIEERMCRWILLTQDRTGNDGFALTQEYLSLMLGVQRPTVSTTAHMLQQAGLITYTRGQMKVLDSEGLAEGACPCYELMESEMDRIYEVPWREMARREDQKNHHR